MVLSSEKTLVIFFWRDAWSPPERDARRDFSATLLASRSEVCHKQGRRRASERAGGGRSWDGRESELTDRLSVGGGLSVSMGRPFSLSNPSPTTRLSFLNSARSRLDDSSIVALCRYQSRH